MRTIGVRELRQQASRVLELAKNGETVEVTDRGRPVALIVPLPRGTPLERMRAEGEVSVPAADLSDLPEPLTLPRRALRPSAVLARLRAHER